MQRISRAPVLSATRSLDSCWITDGLLSYGPRPMAAQRVASQGRRECSYLEGTSATEDAARRRAAHASGHGACDRWSSFSRLDDLCQAPVLRLRQRTRLDNPYDVADLRLVLLVVGVEPRRAPYDLLVLGMCLHGIDTDDDRLVHRARDDDPAALLPPAALVLGLRQPRDRLALGGALPLRLDVLVALGPRHPLALLLRRGRLGGDLGLGCRFLAFRRFFGSGLFGYWLLGYWLLGRRLLVHCRVLGGRRLLGRRLFGRVGGSRNRPLGGGAGLFRRLFFWSLFCLLVLFFVSHSSLDSRSLLVPCGRCAFRP